MVSKQYRFHTEVLTCVRPIVGTGREARCAVQQPEASCRSKAYHACTEVL